MDIIEKAGEKNQIGTGKGITDHIPDKNLIFPG